MRYNNANVQQRFGNNNLRPALGPHGFPRPRRPAGAASQAGSAGRPETVPAIARVIVAAIAPAIAAIVRRGDRGGGDRAGAADRAKGGGDRAKGGEIGPRAAAIAPRPPTAAGGGAAIAAVAAIAAAR